MTLTPDGVRYMAMRSRRVARPFHLRWLMPLLCGNDKLRWEIATKASIVGLGVLAWVYTGSPWMAACVALSGVWFNWRHPVLVDGAGMLLALLSAVLWPVCWPAAVVVAVVAGCVRETAPVWAAVYAWHPVLLIGLVPVGFRSLQRAGTDPVHRDEMLAHPLRWGLRSHRGRWVDPFLMVAPWGPLVLGLAAMSPQLAVALGLAYGQLAIATDSQRLYVWAWPVLAAATVAVVPAAWMPLVALAIVVNPWKGDGL